jgi:hypothetical protein
MGHIHTPKIAGQAPETVSLIIKQVERMLLLAAKSGA